MRYYRESRKPALSVLCADRTSRARDIIPHDTVMGALRNRIDYPRLEPIFGWQVTEHRTLAGLITRQPRRDAMWFEPDGLVVPGLAEQPAGWHGPASPHPDDAEAQTDA